MGTCYSRGRKREKKKKPSRGADSYPDMYRNMLFCSLTNHVIKKNRQSVDEHLKGKKFQRAQGALCFDHVLRLDDATHVNHLSDLIMFTHVNCADHPFYANDSRCHKNVLVVWEEECICLFHTSSSQSCCFCSVVENFQNDRLELYEEPTIEEMEAAIEEMEQENSMEDFEFINEDEEEMNQQKRHRDQKEESDVSVKRTRKYT